MFTFFRSSFKFRKSDCFSFFHSASFSEQLRIVSFNFSISQFLAPLPLAAFFWFYHPYQLILVLSCVNNNLQLIGHFRPLHQPKYNKINYIMKSFIFVRYLILIVFKLSQSAISTPACSTTTESEFEAFFSAAGSTSIIFKRLFFCAKQHLELENFVVYLDLDF